VIDHTNVNDHEEPPGVVTTAMAAVTPPPTGTVNEDLTATIPALAAPAAAETTASANSSTPTPAV
jgi:PiT family inorganic phosphate transporter